MIRTIDMLLSEAARWAYGALYTNSDERTTALDGWVFRYNHRRNHSAIGRKPPIARRIEQTSGQLLAINYGTLYPSLLKLEQEGYIASEWGVSDNNRKAKFYKLTRAGRKRVEQEPRDWERTSAILDRFLTRGEQSS